MTRHVSWHETVFTNNNTWLHIIGDLTDAEVAEIMDAHQRELEEALKKQDREKEKKMEELRKKLAERRRKREAEMRTKHVHEVSESDILITGKIRQIPEERCIQTLKVVKKFF